MRIEQYEGLVNRIEAKAKNNPRLFRLKVVGYIALGYLLVLFIIVGNLLSAAVLFVFRLVGMAFRRVAFCWHFSKGFMRGLWPKYAKTTGLVVDRAQLAPLLEIVEQVTSELGAPKIHAVTLSTDCNASAWQRPSFGPFGPFQNQLVVGLPMLELFTFDEVKGVIAHEIGHIHRGHSRFALRVGQISDAWSGGLKEISAKGFNGGITVDIFNRYSPWLSAAKHVLSRIAEQEANAAESKVVGAAVSTQIMVDLAIYAGSSRDGLRAATVGTYASESMPSNILSLYCEELSKPLARELMIDRIQESLNASPDPFSSHPTMSQILQDVGVEATLENVLSKTVLPGPERVKAGTVIFGDQYDALVANVSKQWATDNEKVWVANRARFLKGQAQVNELYQTVNEKPPTDKERVELASRLLRFDNREEEALRWIEPVRDLNAESRLVYGVILRELKQPDWVPWVERAAEDVEQRESACNVFLRHYTETGDRPQAQRIIELLQGLGQMDAQASANFLHLSQFWLYGPCTWSPEEIQPIVDKLSKLKQVNRAYLVNRTSKDRRYVHGCLVVEYWGGFVRPPALSKKICGWKYPRKCAVFVVQKAPIGLLDVPRALIYERR